MIESGIAAITSTTSSSARSRPGGDDVELVAYATGVLLRSARAPARAQAMNLNYLELDRARIEDQIAAAEANGADPPVELQRARAELTERIARAQT